MGSVKAKPPTVLFSGCQPAVLCGADGRILAVGEAAEELTSSPGRVVELEGAALPGLGDAHIHLDELVQLRSGLNLHGTTSLPEVLAMVRHVAGSLPSDQWVVGRGWNHSGWPSRHWPSRHDLDQAAGGRPVFLASKDEHSVWVSSAALKRAGIHRETPDPPGGLIDREADGQPSGIIREAWHLFEGLIPKVASADYPELLAAVLAELASLGLCTVHTMDPGETLFALQRLRDRGHLQVRVVANLPMGGLEGAAGLGVRSGFGDSDLRIWGIKAFMDGSLGSRTAEMLGGGGVARIPDPDLEELVQRCMAAELNLCLHAIGDKAVHRALVALEGCAGAWPGWRPRIEHAQCVDPADVPRFRRAGAVASMQPIHAVADREMAEAVWGPRARHAYAWGVLADAGVPLAFGSDAPVESADPWRGLEAATRWRKEVGWYPELALSDALALNAYTAGVAYAAGMERECGRLKKGFSCDLTVVKDGEVVATVLAGRISYLRPTRGR